MPAFPNSAAVGQIPLFRHVRGGDLDWLNERLYPMKAVTGEKIMVSEQPGVVLYIILDGVVKIQVDDVEGTDVILSILGPTDAVGEMSMLGGYGARSANVVAMAPSRLLWMDFATFQHSLETMPSVSHNLTAILSDRLRMANEQVRALATLDVQGRVARQILILARQFGRPTADGAILIPLSVTQSDLAALVGASRERVNRVISSSKRQQILSVDDEWRITIHDSVQLAHQCHGHSPTETLRAYSNAASP